MEYDLLYVDGQTSEVQGVLPLIDFSYEEELNEPGSGSMSIRLADCPDLTSDLRPWNTRLFIERSGVILYGGLIETTDVDFGAEVVTVNTTGILGYLRKVALLANINHSSADQDLIARSIVDQHGANVGITSTPNSHGVTRDRTYFGAQAKNAWEALSQLSTVNNGFDFRLSHTRSGSTISSTFTTQYPATGRSTEFTFDAVMLEGLQATIDGTAMVGLARAYGGTVGDEPIYVQNISAGFTSLYPDLHEVQYFGDIQSTSNLSAKALRMVTRGGAPIIRASFTKHPDVLPTLGSYLVGDLVRFRAQYGGLDIDETVRIISQGVTVGSDGKEQTTLSVVSEGAFS